MTTVISVRFRSGTKNYYFDPRDLVIAPGQDVIVETAQGVEIAQCAEGNHAVRDETVVKPLRQVVRIATDNDHRTAEYNRKREDEAFDICQKKIAQHGLDMKLVRVECSFDGSKILFFFTADGRVDFRDLVKDLAGVFRSRIELRQIGVRDEAKMLGGLGICGRPFCCNAYMDDFVPVSIKMAKTQNLSLNPTKISGTCGRLMCCLKYEQDAYEDAIRRMPKNESFVVTPDGPGNVSDVNLLKETVNVRLDGQSDSPKCYHNCEVCVLRNGKGSRDGIAVPDKWPERYVERDGEGQDELAIAPLFSDMTEAEEQAARSARRRRNRGGKGRSSEGRDTQAAEKREEKPAAETRTDAPRKEGEKAEGAKRRRSRGGRGRGGEGQAPRAETKAAEKRFDSPAKADSPAGSSQGGEARQGNPRRRHRGPRRRGGQGGSGQAEA